MSTKTVRSVLLNLLLICALLSTPELVLAYEPDEQPDTMDVLIVKKTSDDSHLEFGVWWVEDYPPAGSGGADLPATRPDALGLRNKLRSTCRVSFFSICLAGWPTPSWIPRYVFGNSSAWESDWKGSGFGGNEEYYVDSVDLAYFAGHGSSNGILFGVGGNTHDDAWLTVNEVGGAWGTRDLDWVGLAACNVLDDTRLGSWHYAMNGLRAILGFKTVMADVPHGDWFGQYLRENNTIGMAWLRAADKLQPQNTIARVLLEERFMFDDRWTSHNRTDYRDHLYSYLTHTVGSEPARFVDASDIAEMPVYMVQPLSLAEANNRWETLGAATGVTVTEYVTVTSIASLNPSRSSLDVGTIRTSQDGQVEMDESNGLFAYNDLDELWVVSSTEPAQAGAVQAISASDAITIAEQFLNTYGFLPDDAQFYEVAADTLTNATSQDGVQASGVAQVLSEETIVHQVIYSRIVSATVPSTSRSVAETVEFSVMGPGSKLKVYVDTTAPAGLSGAALSQESVLGALGGYRAVQQPVSRETNAPLTIPIQPFETMVKILDLNAQGQQELESMFALSHIPLGNIESRTITTNTLAYWEGAMGASQDQLIPVHAIGVRNVLTDSSVVSYTAYIPANPVFMPPLAKIASATTSHGDPLPDQVTVGMSLKLTAADAAKTLADAGYDAALAFTPGSGDYAYFWYVDSVAAENQVGTGLTIDYTVAIPNNPAKLEASTAQQTLILEVVDISSNREPNSSYSRITLAVVPPVLLPTVGR